MTKKIRIALSVNSGGDCFAYAVSQYETVSEAFSVCDNTISSASRDMQIKHFIVEVGVELPHTEQVSGRLKEYRSGKAKRQK